MDAAARFQPAWEQKLAEGKMFQRMECDGCGSRFHFTETPRVSRVPRCPTCGSLSCSAL